MANVSPTASSGRSACLWKGLDQRGAERRLLEAVGTNTNVNTYAARTDTDVA